MFFVTVSCAISLPEIHERGLDLKFFPSTRFLGCSLVDSRFRFRMIHLWWRLRLSYLFSLGVLNLRLMFLPEGVVERTSTFWIFFMWKPKKRLAGSGGDNCFPLGASSWSPWKGVNMVVLERWWCPVASGGLVEVLHFVAEIDSVRFLSESNYFVLVALDYWAGHS